MASAGGCTGEHWCWEHLSFGLSTALQHGVWNAEGRVPYSQMKLSAFYASLINCWGKEPFADTVEKCSN